MAATKMKPIEVLEAFRPPQATSASYVLVVVVTLVAVLGTAPTFLGASIVVPPVIAFAISDFVFRNLHRQMSRCFEAGLTATENPTFAGPAGMRASRGTKCTQREMIARLVGFGVLAPAATVYGTQLGTSFTAAKVACATKLHLNTMLRAAAIPAAAMALWSLAVLGLGLTPIIRGGTLSPLAATLADPLFVFGYVLASSAAATLMVLQKPCQLPSTDQDKVIDDSLAPLNRPPAPATQYHHKV